MSRTAPAPEEMSPSQFIEKVSLITGEVLDEDILPKQLLVQHHRVPLADAAGSGTYQIEIGLYTAITMKRLLLYADGAPVGDRLLLQPVRVRAR